MTAEPAATFLPHGRPFTRADRDALPDDGNRYELIDGTLIVTPSPSWRHQGAAFELAKRLDARCPPELRVFLAPLDVTYAEDTVLQPDVLVVRRSDLGERDLEAGPLLAVEVLSPSTRHLDLAFKRARYEAARCPSYWVVDPLEPSIVCWQLAGDRYGEAARASGADVIAVTSPFPVSLSPAELTDLG
ncbi:MAG: Uma2 family endonuclease [Actinomycetes bacterium]